MIFDLQSITSQLEINLKGVIHVGAFDGSELTSYRKLNLFNTILFEPQKQMYNVVKHKCIDDETVHNIALGSEDKEADMFISNKAGGMANGATQSSSILEPKVHLTEHPEITFPEKETIIVKRFDNFVKSNNIDVSNYNMLNVDVQGYELEVLKGFGDYLNQIDIIIAEVNRNEVYTGCAMIEDIDEYLSQYGLRQASVYWQSASWGDAVYVRN
jgi:FkbM family methyltransferase